jgi:electron transfer flavoprotein beta subunit
MMLTAVCVASVDRRPEVDPMTGLVSIDDRTSGLSLADAAAIEWALRSSERWGGSMMAVTVRPPAAEAVLRDALAVGADRAVRVDAPSDLDADSVAARLADVLVNARAELVWCGDLGADGGSGAVPAFLAARLGLAAALGLVEIAFEDRSDRSIVAVRRLDGGRRERLRVTDRAVLAVEGATARLRRASLAASLAAQRAVVDVVTRPQGRRDSSDQITTLASGPYRPRPRLLPAPASASALERVRQLTGTSSAPGSKAQPGGTARPAPIVATPSAAADEILAALAAWGYELP